MANDRKTSKKADALKKLLFGAKKLSMAKYKPDSRLVFKSLGMKYNEDEHKREQHGK